MTAQYVARNIDLEVRQIFATTTAMPDVDGIYSHTKIDSLLCSDSIIFFWREVERQFDIVVTRAQRASLPTVGSVVHYLKLRAKSVAA